ncbi:serine hydrolase [Hydrogenophilus thiooxidans]|uniref:serine hydrolase n=1 Tax=Hydrogenophilus thiooxidans TaxID=2820326 RepID=UPI001C224356|nr:serine hydrolase [Hydrogenophilus thiooxidans]
MPAGRVVQRLIVGFALIGIGFSFAYATAPGPGLRSEAYLAVDAQSLAVLAQHGDPEVPRPIASITKLLTALVVLEAKQPLQELITITAEDYDRIKGTRSPLVAGTTLTRGDALKLALMASDNRAAMALARHYPGGRAAFVRAMNVKAKMLGMRHSHFVDPAGLSPENVASMNDLVRLVRAAYQDPVIRDYSTENEELVRTHSGTVRFRSTNALVRNDAMPIALQKTGYTREAGRCLVLVTPVKGRPTIFVLLNSQGKYTRVADAKRLRHWLETGKPLPARAQRGNPRAG